MTNSVSIAYLTDYGATFSAMQQPSPTPGSAAGFDVQHNGSVSVAGGDTGPFVTATLGGAYLLDYTTTGTFPLLITFPWFHFGSTSSKNTGATPDYLVGTNDPIGTDTLFKVVASTPTAITPVASAVVVGPNAAMIWKGTLLAVLIDVSGTIKLYTTINTGGAWSNRGAISLARYIRGRYFSNSGQQLFIAADTNLYYSSDFGANLHARTPPVSSALLGIEVVG